MVQTAKNLPANAGDPASIPESGRSPGEGNGNLIQYSYLENSTDRGAWQATVHAWRIPGTGEPGGLPSMGLHRVGHDRSDLAAAVTKYEGEWGGSDHEATSSEQGLKR